MARDGITRLQIRGDRDCTYDLAVTGALDAAAASTLRCLLHDLERDRVTIDLTACTRVTEEALDALAAASRVADAQGGQVRVRPTSGQGRSPLLAAG